MTTCDTKPQMVLNKNTYLVSVEMYKIKRMTTILVCIIYLLQLDYITQICKCIDPKLRKILEKSVKHQQ